MARPIQRLKRFLRAPRVILFELLSIAASGAALTAIPQAKDLAASRTFVVEHPTLARWTHAAALDRVVHSPWFLFLVLLAAASLLNVLVEQWRRLGRQWREPLAEGSFRSASFRRELDRPATGGGPRATFSTAGRIGLFGTPVFHLGLMLIVLAGVARALFSADGVVELAEGQTLAPDPRAFDAGSQGPLAAPFAFAAPIRFEHLAPERYASGALQQLAASLVVGEAGAARPEEIAINRPLDLGPDRLYLVAAHGPAAFVELEANGTAERTLVLLRLQGAVYEETSLHEGGLELRLRGRVGPQTPLPVAIEVRAVRGRDLLYVGTLGPGEGAELPGGVKLSLAAIRYWTTFQGSRDRSAFIAYAGFLLAGLGAALMFAVVKVDTAVVVTPTPAGEHVLVALRAHRFAPLYAERFERLVRESEQGKV
jgi:hypothetical protein